MYAKETVSALPANSGHCAIWRKITRRPSGHGGSISVRQQQIESERVRLLSPPTEAVGGTGDRAAS